MNWREFLNTFGYQTSQLPEDVEFTFVLRNMPVSIMALVWSVIFLMCVYLIYKCYRKEHHVCPPRIKKVLTLSRVFLLVLTSFIFLEPALNVSMKKVVIPKLIVLFDQSSSMAINDLYQNEEIKRNISPFIDGPIGEQISRKKVFEESVKYGRKTFEQLKKTNDLNFYTFGSSVNKINHESEIAELLNSSPNENKTNIIGGVKDALYYHKGDIVSGVLLFTDGQSNDGLPLEEMSKVIGDHNTSLFTIGFGDTNKPQSQSVKEIWAPEKVFKSDPFEIKAIVSQKEMANKTSEVTITQKRIEENGDVIANTEEVIYQQSINWQLEKEEKNIEIKHQFKDEGKYVIEVQIKPTEHEMFAEDNIKKMIVSSLDRKSKVLLVSGSSTWEYQFLTSVFKRDKTVDISCWLQSMDMDMMQDGNTVISQLPQSQEELFKYDVVLLLDPNPAEINEEFIQMLKKFLEENHGGMLFMTGPKYSSKLLNLSTMTVFRELLPVEFSDQNREQADFLKVSFGREWKMQLTPEGLTHFLCQFKTNQKENQKLWGLMPGVYWSYPSIRAKPGAKTLIEHTDIGLKMEDNMRPLYVAGNYGAGKTIYMGFNGTWRWRKMGTKYFDQYWVQAMRYLTLGKLENKSKYGHIRLNKDTYVVGETVHVKAQLNDELRQPVADQAIELSLFENKTFIKKIKLDGVTNKAGLFEGNIMLNKMGDYSLIYDQVSDENEKVFAKYKVEISAIEFENTELNITGLQKISEETNGKFYLPFSWNEVGDDLPNKKEVITIQLKPIQLWDHWVVFTIIISFLTVEWFLRKKYKLL